MDGDGWRCSNGLISRLRGALRVIHACAFARAVSGQDDGNRSCLLVLSGGIPPAWGAPAEAATMMRWIEENDRGILSIPSVKIVMEATSTSTRENAYYSFYYIKKRALGQRKLKTVANTTVVTSNSASAQDQTALPLDRLWLATSPFHRVRSERIFRRLSLTFGVDMKETDVLFSAFIENLDQRESLLKRVFDGIREILATLLYLSRRWI